MAGIARFSRKVCVLRRGVKTLNLSKAEIRKNSVSSGGEFLFLAAGTLVHLAGNFCFLRRELLFIWRGIRPYLGLFWSKCHKLLFIQREVLFILAGIGIFYKVVCIIRRDRIPQLEKL